VQKVYIEVDVKLFILQMGELILSVLLAVFDITYMLYYIIYCRIKFI